MSHRPRWKKWLFAAIKLAVVAILVWFLRDMLSKAFADLSEHTWHVKPAWLVLAGLLYVAGYTPTAVFWQRIMVAAGQPVGLFETIRAWWVSQIAKYVPGKAMVLVVRAGMLRNPNVETSVVTATVFVEVLAVMAVAALLSFVVLLAMNGRELLQLLSGVHSFADLMKVAKTNAAITVIAAFGMLLATGLPAWPPMMKFIVRILGVGKLVPTAAEKLARVPYRVYVFGWLAMAIGWIVQGMGLWATLRSLDIPTSLTQLPMQTATVAMSTVAGFLSFMPGGAFVRELVQTELMTGLYNPGDALVATIIWRLVMLVSELIVSSILYVLGPRGLRRLGAASRAAPEAVTELTLPGNGPR